MWKEYGKLQKCTHIHTNMHIECAVEWLREHTTAYSEEKIPKFKFYRKKLWNCTTKITSVALNVQENFYIVHLRPAAWHAKAEAGDSNFCGTEKLTVSHRLL